MGMLEEVEQLLEQQVIREAERNFDEMVRTLENVVRKHAGGAALDFALLRQACEVYRPQMLDRCRRMTQAELIDLAQTRITSQQRSPIIK